MTKTPLGTLPLKLAGIAIVLGGLALAGQAALATPALAVAHSKAASKHRPPNNPATMSNCPVTFACGWAKVSFNGGFREFNSANPDFRVFTTGDCSSGSWNDCIGSVYNHFRTNNVYWFAGINCAGGASGALEMDPTNSISDLGTQFQSNGNSWFDVISSDNVGSSGSC